MERKIYLTSFHSKIYIPPLQGNYQEALPTPVLQLLPPKLHTTSIPPPPSLPITRDHLHPTPLSIGVNPGGLEGYDPLDFGQGVVGSWTGRKMLPAMAKAGLNRQ